MAKKLPTIDIKGKQYVMVKDRIVAFNEEYPNGSIETEILKNDEASVVVKAVIKPNKGDKTGTYTGHSEAYRNSGQMGAVPVEVAETSAVGRALAMLGIGIIEGVASADEVVKASYSPQNAPQRTQYPKTIPSTIRSVKTLSQAQKKMIERLWEEKDAFPDDPFQYFDNMTSAQASAEINRLMKLPTVNSGDGKNGPDDNVEGGREDFDPNTGGMLP